MMNIPKGQADRSVLLCTVLCPLYKLSCFCFKGTCAFGDKPGIYSNGLTCQQTVTSTPWMCYDSTFNKICCQSCGNIYNASNTGLLKLHRLFFNFKDRYVHYVAKQNIFFKKQ